MSKTFIEMVTEFHRAFNHPVGESQHAMCLDPKRKTARVSWMQEELDEFIEADTVVDQVDALIDLQYFLSGNFVEMGIDQEDLDIIYSGSYPGVDGCPRVDTDYLFSNLSHHTHDKKIELGKIKCVPHSREIELTIAMQNDIDNFSTADDEVAEIDMLLNLQKDIVVTLSEMGVMADQYQRCFEAVHEANMQKLWPDGKPHYNDSNKVVKPEGWEKFTPEPKIEAILFG